MILLEIVAWLRANARPSADLERVISLLCDLRDGEGVDLRAAEEVAILTAAEMGRLIAAPPKPRTSLLFRTMYAAGLRGKETIGLRLADLNGYNCTAFVRGGKGDIDRYVLLDPGTMKALLAWQEGNPAETRLFDYAWATNIYPLFERWCTTLGLWQKYEALGLRLSPHCLRHTCATHCYLRGMSPFGMKAMLGHSELAMTDIYAHGTPEFYLQQYQQSMPREEFDLRGAARGGSLDETLEFLEDTLPATAGLDEVIEALCQRRLGLLGEAAREQVEELGDEVTLAELFRGERLPLIVSRHEVSLLIRAAGDAPEGALFQLLYATGMRGEEALGVSEDDISGCSLRLADRQVFADPATLARWRPFPFSLAEAEERLAFWAARVGVLDRYRGCGRKLSLRLFRHAFAMHRYEDGMDVFCLQELLGVEYLQTMWMYVTAAMGKYRQDYLRCHPLANGEIAL